MLDVAQAATADEEGRTLSTLAYATSEALINATLEFAIGSDVRAQNSAGVRHCLLRFGGCPCRHVCWCESTLVQAS